MNNKFKALVSIIAIVLSAQIFTIPATAGKPQKTVRLQEGDVKILASGTSTTENEAIATALRSALEQAFGTFVSANTTLVNDALVKDEIVSITTGNIKHYDIINSTLLPNGNTTVLLNAIVSTDKLVKYAQNHGASTELAGNKLAMAMRLEQMNIESEWKTMQNLMEQLEAFLPNLFDYEIEVGDPNMKSTTTCVVPLKVNIKSNQNTLSFQKLLKNTLLSLPAATGKIGDVKCCKFVLFGQEKILNEDIWSRSLNRFFNTQLIPQLTAFDIVDQNNNILVGVKITPVKHMIDWEECGFIVKFFGNNIPDYYRRKIRDEQWMYGRETDNGISINKSFRKEQYLHAMSVSSYKPVDFRLASETFLPGVYRYVNKQYGEVLDSGRIIFPFPEINEDILSSRKTKKSKRADSTPTSKSLFCIDWISLTFNTAELNRISEIRIVPSGNQRH